MPDFDIDAAVALMGTAPATPGTSEWVPDADAAPAELPPEQTAAQQSAADDQQVEPGADDTQADDNSGDNAADDTPPAEGEDDAGQDDPGALPIIDPPPSWTAEEKEVFKSLPRAAQEAVARRERDRTAELRRLQDTTAENRKAVDAETTRLKGLADQIDSVVNSHVADLARDFPEIRTEADVVALAQTDPNRFAVFQARVAAVGAAQQAKANAQQALQAKAQEAQTEALKQAHTALIEAFPAWKDPAVAQRELKALQDYAISQGVPEQAARNAIDPFVYKFAEKAMKYDQAQAALAAARDRQPPKVVQKPGTGAATKAELKGQSRQQAMSRLERSGDIDDALSLMFS
jgi:hypothetical protein